MSFGWTDVTLCFMTCSWVYLWTSNTLDFARDSSALITENKKSLPSENGCLHPRHIWIILRIGWIYFSLSQLTDPWAWREGFLVAAHVEQRGRRSNNVTDGHSCFCYKNQTITTNFTSWDQKMWFLGQDIFLPHCSTLLFLPFWDGRKSCSSSLGIPPLLF